MAARTVPTMPDWSSGQKLTSALLQQITTYNRFWANPPRFRMYQTLAQSVPNNAYAQITMDALQADTDSGRAAGTPWSYTIPAGMSGIWEFKIKIMWAPSATGSRLASVGRNGTTDSTAELAALPASAAFASAPGVVAVSLPVSAGDAMSAWGLQDSGGALNTRLNATGASYFEGRLISLASP